MRFLLQALKLWIAERKVKRTAKRIAPEIYGTGKATKGQRDRYVRGQVALWEAGL